MLPTKLRWFERPITNALRRNRSIRGQAERLAKGEAITTHSQMGLTIGMTLLYLEEQKIPYILKALPGYGYTVERWEEGVAQKEKLDGIGTF